MNAIGVQETETRPPGRATAGGAGAEGGPGWGGASVSRAGRVRRGRGRAGRARAEGRGRAGRAGEGRGRLRAIRGDRTHPPTRGLPRRSHAEARTSERAGDEPGRGQTARPTGRASTSPHRGLTQSGPERSHSPPPRNGLTPGAREGQPRAIPRYPGQPRATPGRPGQPRAVPASPRLPLAAPDQPRPHPGPAPNHPWSDFQNSSKESLPSAFASLAAMTASATGPVT